MVDYEVEFFGARGDGGEGFSVGFLSVGFS